MKKFKESNVPWIGRIPIDWKVKKIKRDFIITLGKMIQPQQKNLSETEEYYLRAANIKWEGVDVSNVKKMWFSHAEKVKLKLQLGDLLVSEGGDVGRTSLWKEELPECYIQNAINRIRPMPGKGLNRYLYYWLYTLKNNGLIDAMVSRITIAHLTAEKLEKLIYLKPPIQEQDILALYLNKTCASIDTTITIKQKQLKTLEALKKSIIHKAVTQGLDDSVEMKDSGVGWLGKIPGHWKVKILKRDFKVTLGKMLQSQQKNEAETEEYYLRSANIKWEGVDVSNVKKMWFSPVEKKKLKLESDDLLVSEGGDVGRSSLWNEELPDCYIQNAINRIRPKPGQGLNRFLYYWLLSLKKSGHIDAIASRITIAHLTAEKLEKLIYLSPPINEQVGIVNYLDKKISQIEKLKKKYRKTDRNT